MKWKKWGEAQFGKWHKTQKQHKHKRESWGFCSKGIYFWPRHFQITLAFFFLFTSLPTSPHLRLSSPRWLMVLAAGSKPAVHFVSNVLYHSPLSLKWFSCRPHAQRCFAFKQTCRTHIIHLSLTLSRKPTSTWPIKHSGSALWERLCIIWTEGTLYSA